MGGGDRLQAHSARALLLVALAAFIILGLADGALGVGWPSMRDVFDRGLSELGVLLAFLSVGYLSASTGYGRVHAALGTGLALGVGTTLMMLGLAGISIAPLWPLMVVSVAILGLGGGLVDSGVNAHAALAFDVGSTNLLHASYGVGATLGPIVLTGSLASGLAWRGGYALIAASQAVIALSVWRLRDRWIASTETHQHPDPREAGRGVIPLLLVLFLLYTGVEVATGQWAFTLLTEGRSLGAGVAGFWVAAYWGGLTVGRFSFALIGSRIDPPNILHGSMAVAVTGMGLLWWDPLGLGVVGLLITGLGFSAVFPTMISLTPARIGRVDSTRVVGYQLASANAGAALVPWILGWVAERAGVGALASGLLVAAVVLVFAHLLTNRSFRLVGRVS